MDTMDTLDETIRAVAERIKQLQSSNRALIAQNDELRAVIRQMVLEPLGLWRPPQLPEPMDALTQRLWTPEPDQDAVKH